MKTANGTAKAATPRENGSRASSQAQGGASKTFRAVDLAPHSVKLGRILVPLDFSSTSMKALRYALSFAAQFRAKIALVHVVEPVIYAPADLGYPPAVDEEDAIQPAIERLEKVAKRAVEPRLYWKSVVRIGHPYEEIITVARELEADLIIITTHGYTGLKHVLMGSTAERVVRRAPCPVLTVREREREFV